MNCATRVWKNVHPLAIRFAFAFVAACHAPPAGLRATATATTTSAGPTEVANANDGGMADSSAARKRGWQTGEWFKLLDHDGKEVALVSAGLFDRHEQDKSRPVVFSIHGKRSNPQWNCPHVRYAFGPKPWVVCPHPSPDLGEPASWRSAGEIAKAIETSMALLQEKVGPYVDDQDVHFIGHSQGSVQAPRALSKLETLHMRSVTLFDGPPDDAARAHDLLKKVDPERVLLITSSGWGGDRTRELAKELAEDHISVRLRETRSGHHFNDQIYETLWKELPWLMPETRPATAEARRP